METLKIGLIGLGRMGEMYLRALLASEVWQVVYICDVSPIAKELAAQLAPKATFVTDEDIIFNDPKVNCVGLFTLADVREAQIEKALKFHKHVIAEKPIAYNLKDELRAVEVSEAAEEFTTVNLYLRNAWFCREMKRFVQSGEIGELAIIRVCHMTPGLSPGEGHEFEGPSFHDCGMHYVDITRFFADSEFSTGHAQAVRMWSYKDPWWLQCHGTFENGIVYDITQGFVYGQLSKDQTHNSYIELIGTHGFVRMTHDFKTAVVEKHGINITERVERPHGGKNIARLCQKMADSIVSGRRSTHLPSFRDSYIASEWAWKMLDDCRKNDLPAIGNLETLHQIHVRRANMTNGYGLLKKR
ncbi:MAG: Gfo/Idh/MocA family oxidoreductase [Bacteroidaceae bacterium]|nr:Gfo/Idh/MocA family oxidoreductase [Bacteroidaceae bacterium]